MPHVPQALIKLPEQQQSIYYMLYGFIATKGAGPNGTVEDERELFVRGQTQALLHSVDKDEDWDPKTAAAAAASPAAAVDSLARSRSTKAPRGRSDRSSKADRTARWGGEAGAGIGHRASGDRASCAARLSHNREALVVELDQRSQPLRRRCKTVLSKVPGFRAKPEAEHHHHHHHHHHEHKKVRRAWLSPCLHL